MMNRTRRRWNLVSTSPAKNNNTNNTTTFLVVVFFLSLVLFLKAQDFNCFGIPDFDPKACNAQGICGAADVCYCSSTVEKNMPEGLLAHAPFDNLNNRIAVKTEFIATSLVANYQSVGYNTGILGSSRTFEAAKKQQLRMDGSSGFGGTAATEFTISLWFYLESKGYIPGRKFLYESVSSDEDENRIYIALQEEGADNTTLTIRCGIAHANVIVEETNITVTSGSASHTAFLNTWHHLAVWVKAPSLRVVLDKVLMPDVSVLTGAATNVPNGPIIVNLFSVGSTFGSPANCPGGPLCDSSNYLNGALDEFIVFGTQHSLETIQAIYNHTLDNSNAYGATCEHWKCYGEHRLGANVCSQHGTCTAPNTCVCNDKWGGPDCSVDYGTQLNPAKNCLSLKNSRPASADGVYWIKPNTVAYQVYCQFGTDGAWTLIESASLANKITSPFTLDNSVNGDAVNFDSYRMSKNRMIELLSLASDVRATCNSTAYTSDYVIAKTANLDIMSSYEGTCVNVTAVNVRSYSCTNCNTRWFQTGAHLYLDSAVACPAPPALDATVGSVPGEQSFGGYNTFNNAFTCAASEAAVTNWWLKISCDNETTCSGNGYCNSAKDGCICNAGFTGVNCASQQRGLSQSNPAQSCMGVSLSGLTISGAYWLQPTPQIAPFKAFCDFTSIYSTGIWTLIESFKLTNNASHNAPFTESLTKNPLFPNVENYRLSKDQIANLSLTSGYWRATCSYPSPTTQDYVIGSLSELDILSFQSVTGSCRVVAQADIKGTTCFNCNTTWFQGAGSHLYTSTDSCSGNTLHATSGVDRAWGNYVTSSSSTFACTANSESTTNWWLRSTCDELFCLNGGTCDVTSGICSCPAGWTGTRCQMPICFGKLPFDQLVCNGHGSCFSNNTCTCYDGYTGTQCQTPICYGRSNSTACSGQGNCTAYNTCTCNNGYSGNECEIFRCATILRTDPEVCNSRGNCTAPDSCSCNAGYTGSNCEIRTCAGISAQDPNVCNRRGSCVQPNLCYCDDGYTGNNCQFPKCYDKYAGDAGVCSDRGTCVDLNKCVCDTGYGGNKCDGFVWNGAAYRYFQTQLTYEAAKASCVNDFGGTLASIHSAAENTELVNRASLKDGFQYIWIGVERSPPDTVYYNIDRTPLDYNNWKAGEPSLGGEACAHLYSASSVDKYKWNDMSCSTNYQYFCKQTLCYGKKHIDAAVCSGKGVCYTNNTCVCDAGYYGTECQYASCYGVPGNSSSACSGNGTCLTKDNCVCNNGYTGNQCQYPVCFGKPANDSSVCSGNGACTSNNTCTCYAGFNGAQCETQAYNCFGYAPNDARVCSFGNGTCAANNTCVCNSGYFGAKCEVPSCNGTLANDTTVCSGHGSCIRKDTCQCTNTTNYVGVNCEYPICFGVAASMVNLVCGGNGTCVSPNNCSCHSGFYGDRCQNYDCFSVPSSQPSTCSGNGTCIGPNVCSCNAGYYGDRCQNYDCYLTPSTSPDVCSTRNGTCVSPDKCQCNTGYTGDRCHIPICHSIMANDTSTACSGNGTCVAKDKCSCFPNYAGERCNIPVCYGKLATDPSVCTFSNGTCSGPNRCQCADGYSGEQCHIPSCFGLPANNTNVCNQHGQCVKKDQCACNAGYVGSTCSTPVCYGVSATNLTHVCNSRGSCDAPDTCVCAGGYSGSQCELNLCFGIASNSSSTVCSGHGNCTAPNTCSCATGYTDLNCNMPICFGVNASNPLVCAGNGSCAAPDTCQCSTGFSSDGLCKTPTCYGKNATDVTNVCSGKGYCTSPDMCICQAGYYGNQCHMHDCYGVEYNSSLVCSGGNGTCESPDKCSCHQGYNGDRCQVPICYSTRADDSTVCSRNGTCVRADTCHCNQGYTGATCNVSICFGVESTNNLTCSGNGSCLSKDNCQCRYGWKGVNCEMPDCPERDQCSSANQGTCVAPNVCQCMTGLWTGVNCAIPVCFGVDQRNSTVCSSRGNCTAPNTCSCQPGYNANQCQQPICFGKNSTDVTVCSGNGKCIAPDTCQCVNLYAGAQCSVPRCSGVPATDAYVCSGRGACVSPNTCQCQSDYNGTNCEVVSSSVTSCFGRSAADPLVCNGRGTCSKPNVCTCQPGYFGLFCQDVNCFSKLSSDVSVCSGNGICGSADNCTCQSGYSGAECEVYSCNNVLSTNAQVCGGKGKCIAPDTCQCNSGYVGVNCNVPVCYGKNATESTVCSSFGTCDAPNTCKCNAGYQGLQCDVTTCFGLSKSDTRVCSRRGACVAKDSCACNDGYSGAKCEYASCFGKNATDPTVCGGKGTCQLKDTCTCYADNVNGYWTGPTCDSCTKNYQGVNCLSKTCDELTSCSNHGTCSAQLDCVCYQDQTRGFWNSTYCDKCAPNYYGSTCLQRCVAAETCSGHGVCNVNGECTCFDSDTDGHFTGVKCDSCQVDWSGKNCKSYASPTFAFANTGDRIIGQLALDGAENAAAVDCSKILDSTSRQLIGAGALCLWSKRLSAPVDYRYFEIIFGASPTITLVNQITINLNGAANTTVANWRTITLTAPETPVKPIAKLTGPSLIGPCDDMSLDASLSSSSDRRKINFVWNVQAVSTDVTVLQAFLSTQSKSELVIPANLMSPYTYTVTVTIMSFLGANSSASLQFVKSQLPTATAVIVGPPAQTIFASTYLKVDGRASFSESCFYDDKTIIYTWRQTAGVKVTPVIDERFLIFPSFTFRSTGVTDEYEFELQTQPAANLGIVSTARVKIIVDPQLLVAAIRGGNRIASTNATLSLDASPSYDPDNVAVTSSYSWTCTDAASNGFCPFNWEYEIPSQATLSLPKGLLPAGTYVFAVTYSKGARYSSTEVTVTFVEASPPQVSMVNALKSKINQNDRLAIEASSTFDGNPALFTMSYAWEAISSSGRDVLTDSMSLTPLNQPVLAIRSGALTVGETYIFKITATASTADGSLVLAGSAQTEPIAVNTPPLPGLFEVAPIEGSSLDTTFVMSCSQWSDVDLPIQYSFYYIGADGNAAVINRLSQSNKYSTKLPAGLPANNYTVTLVAKVMDSLGAVSTLETNVVVYPPTVTNSSELVALAQSQTSKQVNDALTQRNYEAVTQLIGVLSQVINVAVTNQSTTTSTTTSCLNDCSGHGQCVDRACICDAGYVTSDCSLTAVELNDRQSLRSQLLSSLMKAANGSAAQEPTTTESLAQQVSVMSSITGKPEELSIEAKQLAVNYVSSLIGTGSQVTVTDEAAAAFGASLSNLGEVAFQSSTNGSSDNRQLSTQLTGAITKLLAVVVSTKLPGEEAQVISQPTMQLRVQRLYTDNLNNLKVVTAQYGNAGTSSQFTLPSSFLSDIQKRKTRRLSLDEVDPSLLESVDIQAANYAKNPYAWSPTSNNMSTSVVSMSLKTADNREVRVYNLSAPIRIVIPGRFNLSSVTQPNADCLLTESILPECRYWDAIKLDWSTDGCSIVSITDDSATCLCNHLTDFAAFLKYVLPTFNVLTPEDFKNLANLNMDNSGTTWVMVVLAVTYVIAMIIGFIVDRVFVYSDEEIEKKKALLKLGRVSDALERVKTGHIWLSLVVKPASEYYFSRPQRITCTYAILLSCLCCNALVYSSVQPNLIQMIACAIIGAIVTFPTGMILVTLFKCIRPYKKVTNKTLRLTRGIMINPEFEMAELATGVSAAAPPAAPLAVKPASSKSTEGDDSLAEIAKKRKSVIVQSKTIERVQDRVEARKSVHVSLTSETEQTAHVSKVAQKMTWYKKKEAQVNAWLDAAFDKVEIFIRTKFIGAKMFKNKRVALAAVILGLLLFFLFYFGIFAVACVIMENFFANMWQPYFTTLVMCLTVLLAVFGFEYLYFSRKRELFRYTLHWKVTKKAIVTWFLALMASLLFVVVTAGIACACQFWKTDLGIAHTSVVLICEMLLVGLVMAWLIIYLKKPKVIVQQPQEAAQQKQGFGFPWWFIFFAYPLSWLAIAVMSVILVVYSIKFGPNKNAAWLRGSATGIGTDVFLGRPLSIMGEAIFWGVVLELLNMAFFRSYDVAVTVNKGDEEEEVEAPKQAAMTAANNNNQSMMEIIAAGGDV